MEEVSDENTSTCAIPLDNRKSTFMEFVFEILATQYFVLFLSASLQ